MRIIKQNIDRDASGSITLFPEEPEDMWHAYNLIRPGDGLRAAAIRRVTTESATGSTSSTRVHTNFLIRVTSVDFDPTAGELHIAGRIAEENKFAKIGAHHTLDLELRRNFMLEKVAIGGSGGGGGWDSIALGVVKEATDPRERAEVVAVVMQEGLGNVCLITEHQTVLRQRVEMGIPRKAKGRVTEHDKGLNKFFSVLLTTLLRHADLLTKPKPILLASPGFTAASFHKHILNAMSTPPISTDKPLSTALRSSAMVVAHSSSGHLHALSEVLASPTLRARLSDSKFARETAAMDSFMEVLRRDDGRAWYGPREVERAVEKGAAGRGGGILLISDTLFRANEVGTRRRWVRCVEKVKEDGGEVRICSSQHESGRRLDGLGGVAALLTFPLLDLDEGSDDDEADADADAGDGEPNAA
ncbi:MAG: Translation factor pelota [Sclerophora amabilis]|nr:MAG: Translation factor pelota [Sclerophora amabilis]